ncbi:acyl-CoA dehydrogenase [Chitinivorax sp. PXF-14]|uniref:acyl-CoA dehydrogenase n=1 Tax=Chitinivorax sp. PXF-14 TaxID=3230488 RepID=UPI0034654F5A
MSHPLINPRDLAFQLYELLPTEALTARPRFADHSRETFDAAIDTARHVAEQYFAPHNRELDEHEPEFDGQRVHIIPQVKAALDAFADAGFLAAHHDYALGGMQLPHTVVQACQAYFQAANIATSSYAFLTTAAANVIHHFGSDEQKRRFLEPMLTGRFTGTMALTEPHAGSSLGDLRTAAEPQPDGSYRLSGNKIFISGGDHELSENIVHLVLARIKGAPAAVKGISLFIVPKFLVGDDGALGARNDVALAGLLHKMGWRGTTSTMLNFGEQGGAIGYLVGEPNHGLRYMFHMMNEARIGVGMGATMLGYAGYLYSLDYARSRPQGRPASSRDFGAPQVPIIEHADVRHMLLQQKAYVEGALALEFYCAALVDDIATAPDQAQRDEARLLLELLTPIAKAWPAKYCLKANELAVQVLGGYGFTRDYPVEQYYRDNRLNPIHEGTNGIQALDLLGRKVTMQDGAAFKLLLQRIGDTCREAATLAECAPLAAALADAAKLIGELTLQLAMSFISAGVDRTLANASLYLDLAGRVVLSWMWLRQAMAAERGLAGAAHDDEAFYRGKLQAARYYLGWELPEIRHQADLLRGLDTAAWEMQGAWF